MLVDFSLELPTGSSWEYEGEEFLSVPRVGEGIVVDDSEQDVEVYGTVTGVFWSAAGDNGWRPNLRVKINDVAGEGREKYLAGEEKEETGKANEN